MLIAQIEDLIKNCVKIVHPYLLYFPRNNPSKSDTDGSGRAAWGGSSFIQLVLKWS